jgi:hypothetical protein
MPKDGEGPHTQKAACAALVNRQRLEPIRHEFLISRLSRDPQTIHTGHTNGSKRGGSYSTSHRDGICYREAERTATPYWGRVNDCFEPPWRTSVIKVGSEMR